MAQQSKVQLLDDDGSPLLDDDGNPLMDDSIVESESPKNESFIKQAWNSISEPLTDLPSRVVKPVADYIDEPVNEDSTYLSGVKAKLKGFTSGALQVGGDMLSSMSSPINLATTLLTSGSGLAAKKGLDSVANLLRTGSKISGGLGAAHGGNEVYEGLQEGDLVKAGTGLVETAGNLIPFAGGKSKSVSKPTSKAVDEIKPKLNVDEVLNTEPQIELPVKPKKPAVRLNPDGTYTKFDTGEVVDSTGRSMAEPITNQPELTRDSDFFVKNRKGEDVNVTAVVNKASQAPKPEQALNEINQLAKELPDKEKDGLYTQTSNFIRSTLTSMDLSALRRQGLGMITHPEYWRNIDDMFRAFGSKKAYDAIETSIKSDPSGYFAPKTGPKGKPIKSFAEDVGLDLTDYFDKRDEMFSSKLAEKIPGIAASKRAYTAFLNKTRADIFKKYMNNAKADGRDYTMDLPAAQQIAKAINISSGRGSYGKLEEAPMAMKALSEMFFAPKLMASRVQMYTRVFNPKTYTSAPPEVRQEALRSLLGVAGNALLIQQLGKLAGADVTYDPHSADFGKVKFGNTRYDPMGGLQQYLVAGTKLLTGESKSTTSNRTDDLTDNKGLQTRASVVSNFMTNKLAPIPSFIWAWMEGREFDGEPFDVKMGIVNRTVPIIVQDLIELQKQNPDLIPQGIIPPIFGDSIQTYGR